MTTLPEEAVNAAADAAHEELMLMAKQMNVPMEYTQSISVNNYRVMRAALTAALPFLPVQGAVKKLEWEPIDGGNAFRAPALIFGWIRVEHYTIHNWQVQWSVPGICNILLPSVFTTPDEAKAAAQADYEARILSALEPSAALPFLPVQGAVKKLEWGNARITEDGREAEDAQSPVGRYIATDTGWFLLGQTGYEVERGLYQAKAAAQADYEARILSALEPSAARKLALEEAHADDVAVDRFAVAMKEKLAKKRAEGRGGWENKDECSAEYLSYLLIQHIWKGDPVDIANLAMMLQQRGERVVIDRETSSIIPDHADAGKVERDGRNGRELMRQEVVLMIERFYSDYTWHHQLIANVMALPSAPSQEVAGS